tara:strand:- start:128 stop:655 length:528 start_codon:yes stop_codon:yes gene_type:complete
MGREAKKPKTGLSRELNNLASDRHDAESLPGGRRAAAIAADAATVKSLKELAYPDSKEIDKSCLLPAHGSKAGSSSQHSRLITDESDDEASPGGRPSQRPSNAQLFGEEEAPAINARAKALIRFFEKESDSEDADSEEDSDSEPLDLVPRRKGNFAKSYVRYIEENASDSSDDGW